MSPIRFILFSTEAHLLNVEEIECEPLQLLILDIVQTGQQGGEYGEGEEEDVSRQTSAPIS